jgi:hypothetical protein
MKIKLPDGSWHVDVFLDRSEPGYDDNVFVRITEECPERNKLFGVSEHGIPHVAQVDEPIRRNLVIQLQTIHAEVGYVVADERGPGIRLGDEESEIPEQQSGDMAHKQPMAGHLAPARGFGIIGFILRQLPPSQGTQCHSPKRRTRWNWRTGVLPPRSGQCNHSVSRRHARSVG